MMKIGYFQYTGEQLKAFEKSYEIKNLCGRMALAKWNYEKGSEWVVLMGLDKPGDEKNTHIHVAEFKTFKAADKCFNVMSMTFQNDWVDEGQAGA